jgi:hypothetical protein
MSLMFLTHVLWLGLAILGSRTFLRFELQDFGDYLNSDISLSGFLGLIWGLLAIFSKSSIHIVASCKNKKMKPDSFCEQLPNMHCRGIYLRWDPPKIFPDWDLLFWAQDETETFCGQDTDVLLSPFNLNVSLTTSIQMLRGSYINDWIIVFLLFYGIEWHFLSHPGLRSNPSTRVCCRLADDATDLWRDETQTFVKGSRDRGYIPRFSTLCSQCNNFS